MTKTELIKKLEELKKQISKDKEQLDIFGKSDKLSQDEQINA